MEDLKVFKVCEQIVMLKESDIAEAQEEIERQINYISPLKAGTQTRVNESGKRNMEVLDALKSLKKLIERGDPNK